MVEGLYVHLPTATLTTKLALWQAAEDALANGHQSYSIAGRSITRADASFVAKQISEYSYALSLADGSINRVTFANMQGGPG